MLEKNPTDVFQVRAPVVGRARWFAAVVLSIVVAGCPMTLRNEAQSGRLTAGPVDPEEGTMVFGLDASRGPMIISLLRYSPSPGWGKCSEAMASTPENSNGTTYHVFSTPPGDYIVRASMPGAESLRYVVPAGKQVYIGDFAVTPGGQTLSQFDPNRRIGVSRNIDAAKAALGPKAARLELAQTASPGEDLVGFVCMP